MNDLLTLGGASCVIVGCYLITPAAALVATGLLLICIGVIRTRSNHGPH